MPHISINNIFIVSGGFSSRGGGSRGGGSKSGGYSFSFGGSKPASAPSFKSPSHNAAPSYGWNTNRGTQCTHKSRLSCFSFDLFAHSLKFTNSLIIYVCTAHVNMLLIVCN